MLCVAVPGNNPNFCKVMDSRTNRHIYKPNSHAHSRIGTNCSLPYNTRMRKTSPKLQSGHSSTKMALSYMSRYRWRLMTELACNLVSKAYTASTVDASVHGRLDKRTKVLVLHSTLHLNETPSITAILHCLVLQITFTSLIADGAIQGVVDLHKTRCQFLTVTMIGLHLHSRMMITEA